MASADDRVLIAGAGPVGLVLALSLAGRGHRVLVVEKLVDLLDQVRRAGTIHAATLEMLDDIGLYDRLEPRGIVAPLVHYWDRGDPEPIAVFDHGALAGDTRFPHALQCDRLKLVEEALKMASGNDLIEIRTGTELVGFRQTSDSVTAAIETADGEREELRGTHLVGCEGAHSVVRKQLGIDFEGFAFPDRTMTLSVLFDFDSILPYGHRNYILDPVEWANLFRWTDLWRVVLPADVDADPDALLDDDVIEAGLQRFHPTGTRYEVLSKSLYTVHQRVAETFRVGRVLLAGDAAHVNSPIGAMGMNSGIHDAGKPGRQAVVGAAGRCRRRAARPLCPPAPPCGRGPCAGHHHPQQEADGRVRSGCAAPQPRRAAPGRRRSRPGPGVPAPGVADFQRPRSCGDPLMAERCCRARRGPCASAEPEPIS